MPVPAKEPPAAPAPARPPVPASPTSGEVPALAGSGPRPENERAADPRPAQVAEDLAEVDELLDRAARQASQGDRPTYQRVLGVTEACRAELAGLTPGSTPSNELVLWRLAHPGTLVAGTGQRWVTTWSLAAVLTVALLGLLGLVGAAHLVAAPAPSATSSRASAIARATLVWLGSSGAVGVVALVALALVVAALLARRRCRAAEAGELRLAHIERRLVVRVSRLSAALRGPDRIDPLRGAVAELAFAARGLGDAARSVAASERVVERLTSAAIQVAASLPEATAQAETVATLEQRVRRTAEEIGRAAPPLTELVEATLMAATQVREAVELTGRQLRASVDLVERTADHRAALDTGERPFTTAATQLAALSGTLDAATTALRDSVEQMGAAVRDANWLVLVADGLRAEPDHHQDEHPGPSQS